MRIEGVVDEDGEVADAAPAAVEGAAAVGRAPRRLAALLVLRLAHRHAHAARVLDVGGHRAAQQLGAGVHQLALQRLLQRLGLLRRHATQCQNYM